jgi:cytochrome c oxidase subunit 2
MAITPPASRNWWSEPVERTEALWIGIALIWAIIMFFMMPYWHVFGEQNLSNEAYRINPDDYVAKVDAFVDQYQVREEGDTGIPVVAPPPGSDVYLLARRWEWYPIIELQKGQQYRFHISSSDWLHGFSLQPTNINLQVHPGYEMVINLTPTEAGEFGIVCNEYCGIGHHLMLGRMYVKE